MKIPTTDVLNPVVGSLTDLTSFRNTTFRYTTTVAATTSSFIDYSDAPLKRGGHSCISFNSSPIVFGGGNIPYLNDVLYYDFSKQHWRAMNTTGTAPSPRTGHCAHLINVNKMIVFGGENATTRFNDVFLLDLVTNAWSSPSIIGTPPTGRSFFASVMMSATEMLVFAGKTGTNPGSYVNNLWKLDISTFTWSEVADPSPPAARAFMSAVYYGTKMYVWGGRNGSGSTIAQHRSYDTSTNTWQNIGVLPNDPSARCFHSVCLHNGFMYVFGGTGGNPASGNALGNIFKYDIVANTWSTPVGAVLPSARMGATLCVIGDFIYCFGGFGSGGYSVVGKDDLWRTDSTITFTQQAGGTASVNANTFTKDNWQFNTGVVGGFAYIDIKAKSDVAADEIHMLSSLKLLTA